MLHRFCKIVSAFCLVCLVSCCLVIGSGSAQPSMSSSLDSSRVKNGQCSTLPFRVCTVLCLSTACKSDAECPGNQKCCKNPCCGQCVAPVVSPKRGRCPVIPPGTIGTCIVSCNGDESCPGKQKCCSNGCGRTCHQPAISYD